MSETRPDIDILVCNDDGITAPGVYNLVQAVRPFGKITVVCPDSPQSGMGHAISVGKPLRLDKFEEVDFGEGVEAWSCSGTPVDCVKLAAGVILKHKPDLLVSGVNHGLNASISVFYSGTMSAAVEGAIEGFPSIGFSLDNFSVNADFAASRAVVAEVVQAALAHEFPHQTALNVNIPDVPLEEIKGIRVTRQATGRWVEEFEQRADPYGRDYYWLTGSFHLNDEGEDTDIWALRHNYVSICPVEIDATAHHNTSTLNQWRFERWRRSEE